MMRINIIAIGKVKEDYFVKGIEEYSKRLGKYCDFNVIELQEENYKKIDDGIIREIKEKEGKKILSAVKGYVVVMAIEGQKFTSEKFAKTIESLSVQGVSTLSFVIGGSYGVSDEVKKRADKLISFSDMTFPHTMFRLMLTEQIYRAFSILEGTSYHK